MFSIYQLFCMNNKKLNFSVFRSTWGNLTISVDRIDNIHYSAKDWRCDAYTKDKSYLGAECSNKNNGNDTYKLITCGGNYSWQFVENIEYDTSLLPQAKNPSVKGLKTQKAGKEYNCYHCKRLITKGELYERYAMRSARELGAINEVFCIGHRDKMRTEFFGKKIEDIKYSELMDAWNNKVLV